jgi:hypothetical protein
LVLHELLSQFISQSKGFYFLFRNVKPAFQKLGLYGGLAYTGLFYIFARGKEPWTFKHGVSPVTVSLCMVIFGIRIRVVTDPHRSGSAWIRIRVNPDPAALK